MTDELEFQVDRNISLAHEKIRLEAELGRLRTMYDELVLRFNALQDMHWKLQDRHMKLQETLVNTVTSNNLRDYNTPNPGDPPW